MLQIFSSGEGEREGEHKGDGQGGGGQTNTMQKIDCNNVPNSQFTLTLRKKINKTMHPKFWACCTLFVVPEQ